MYIFFFMIILFFLPIPIKFSVITDITKIDIYIYRKLVKSLAINFLNLLEKKDSVEKGKLYSFPVDWRKFLHTMKIAPLKLRLSYNCILYYDTPDAFGTAMLNSLLNLLTYNSHNFLLWFFKIKRFNIKVHPLFKNKFNLKFHFKGIIYVNLVKILIIAFNILKCKKKEVSPLREAYEH